MSEQTDLVAKLTKEVEDLHAHIKKLNERIAYLEEAGASFGVEREITVEEWQSNFRIT